MNAFQFPKTIRRGRTFGKVTGGGEINWSKLMKISGLLGWSPEDFHNATLPELIFHYYGYLEGQGVDLEDATNAPPTRDEIARLEKELNL